MNRTTLALIVLSCTSFFGAAATFADGPPEIEIEYRRLASAGGPSVSPPAAGELPRALEIDPAGGAADAGTPADPELETRAVIAATWAARQRLEHFGRREIYGAGFHDGLKTALGDPVLGEWDARQGFGDGARDPQALAAGRGIGAESAARAAEEAAAAHVTAQFHDLDREPRLDPWPRRPPFAGTLPAVRAPRMIDVFDRFPVRSLRQVDVEPLPDPWKLYRSDGYADFYRDDWTDARKAFAYWLEHHRDRASWLGLESERRARFERLFLSAFGHQLKELSVPASERIYGDGFDDGWHYGCLVTREWSYRRGYHEGFETALRDAAESTFESRFSAAYEERYRDLFRQWSTSARPEIRDVSLDDASGDGVFEPGEKIAVANASRRVSCGYLELIVDGAGSDVIVSRDHDRADDRELLGRRLPER